MNINNLGICIRRKASIACFVTISALISGCTVMTVPITDAERDTRVETDLKAMFKDQEPLTGPLDFAAVVARAISYNLDHRLKVTEQALAAGDLRVARYDMLPRIVAEAGYIGRSDFRGTNSRSLLDGTQSLESSTSEDRDRETGKLTAVWNILDFGVAYARAQQSSDQVLITRERSRRVLDNIMLDVRNAFWRAISAQSHLGEIDKLIKRVRSAIDRSRVLETKRLQDPLTSLTFQRELLETLRKLIEERRKLSLAKTKLAALINLPPGENFDLVVPKYDVRRAPTFNTKISDLERKAMLDRPELREEGYLKRIHQAEVRKAYFRMFPRLDLEGSLQTDSNSFLFNNEWAEWNVRVSYNLIRLFQGPAEIDLAKAQLNVSDARRLALTMAILAQVRISHHQYQLAIGQLKFASDLEQVDTRIFDLSNKRRAANMADELELIQRSSNRMLSLIELNSSYADVQNAFGRIMNAVGRDPLPLEAEASNMQALIDVIRDADQDHRNALYGIAKADPEVAPAPEVVPETDMKPEPQLTPESEMAADPEVAPELESARVSEMAVGPQMNTELELGPEPVLQTEPVLKTESVIPPRPEVKAVQETTSEPEKKALSPEQAKSFNWFKIFGTVEPELPIQISQK
jgi:outer membrane protein, multidrug efflux system